MTCACCDCGCGNMSGNNPGASYVWQGYTTDIDGALAAGLYHNQPIAFNGTCGELQIATSSNVGLSLDGLPTPQGDPTVLYTGQAARDFEWEPNTGSHGCTSTITHNGIWYYQYSAGYVNWLGVWNSWDRQISTANQTWLLANCQDFYYRYEAYNLEDWAIPANPTAGYTERRSFGSTVRLMCCNNGVVTDESSRVTWLPIAASLNSQYGTTCSPPANFSTTSSSYTTTANAGRGTHYTAATDARIGIATCGHPNYDPAVAGSLNRVETRESPVGAFAKQTGPLGNHDFRPAHEIRACLP